jgi:hypothetical protein
MATLLAGGLAEVRDATMSNIGDDIGPFAQERIPFTSGFLYRAIQFRLTRYPIPELRLDPGGGKQPLNESQ